MFGSKFKNLILLNDSYVLLFLFSILFCLVVLNIENLIGINLEFHPDSLFYIERAGDINFNQFQFKYIYFFYVKLIMNPEILIIINIILYSFTNIFLYSFFKKKVQLNRSTIALIIFFIIFNPLRAHYAVHLLKETLIIFLLVSLFISRKSIFAIIFLLLGFFLRPAFFIYSLLLYRSFNLKYSFFIVVIPIIFFVYHYFDAIKFVIFQTNGDMQFRSFDTVPNFIDLGFLGQIYRSLTWPIFLLSGIFAILSPSLFFIPIGIYNFIYLSLCVVISKDYKNIFVLFVILSIFGFIVSGFTSYIRYSLPVFTLLPLLMVSKLK